MTARSQGDYRALEMRSITEQGAENPQGQTTVEDLIQDLKFSRQWSNLQAALA
jgi:hypothetical protein